MRNPLPLRSVPLFFNGGECCRLIVLLIIFSFAFNASAQTLFTYGKHAVSKDEFIKAYNKNNTDTSGSKISYADYLELYSRFKLKVQDALDLRMDTIADLHAELTAFRYQLAENYMKEEASIELLANEAAERLKKDIHITIDDKEVGWITAFVLPYEIENIAYNTPVGKSSTFTTANGEHTLKNLGEREAIGQVRIAQILLAFRPDATEADKQMLAQRADSVYNALTGGADFGEMVGRYTNDNLTYETKGEMPAFGVGRYDPVFEKAAFALEKDSDISKPFATSFGYHIIKRLGRVPVDTNKEAVREKVLTSDRMQVAQKMLVKNIRATIKNDAPADVLTSDSAVLDYYRNNLEKYNIEFADQLNEFRQGNLLFAVMQKKVWDSASSDTTGLLKYYNEHKDKYFWENSADALIITSLTPRPAEELQAEIKSNASRWRRWAEGSGGTVQVDSGRFELSQIPVVGRTNFTEGLATAPVLNEQDSTSTLAYIIKLYPNKEPKRFEDAKGSVINDYQLYLEERWLAELKKKYPVKVNRKEFKKLPK